MSNSIALVIDNGSGYLKMGIAPEDKPRIMIPTIIGRKYLREDANSFKVTKQVIYGDEALANKDNLEITYPIENGTIKQKDDLAEIWKYALDEKLKIKKDDYDNMKVLVTEAPFLADYNKENIFEILFEKLHVGYGMIEPQASLCLYCEGKDTGIVLDSGDGVSHCIPIINSATINIASTSLLLGGRFVSNNLIELLRLKGYNFNSTSDFQGIKTLKENHCFVSSDIEKDRKLVRETSFYNSYHLIEGLLPDNERIFLSSEKFEAPEVLFDGSIDHSEYRSLHEMLFWSVMHCPIDNRKELFNNIVLSGGNTMFTGFINRMELEVKKLIKKGINEKADELGKSHVPVGISDHFLRKYAVFSGGSIIANYYNNPEGEEYWISRKEYEEAGAYKAELIKSRCKSLTS